MRFEFGTVPKIIFGPNTIHEAAPIAASYGDIALVVVGRDAQRSAALLEGLKHHGVKYHLFNVTGEPTVAMVQAGSNAAAKSGCRVVISMGGGSVIDAGKAIAAHLTNPGDLYNYLEVVGKGRPLMNHAAAFIAIPTTAGTGAEATANAVLQSVSHGVKVSLRSSLMLPKAAIVDPTQSLAMPSALTAATGMDALTQLIEAFVTPMNNPLTDALCREGIRRAARSLFIAYENGGEIEARTDMALAALFSGIALANAKLGAVHGIAGPLGGMIEIPHGVACAGLLPTVMEVNLKALRGRQPSCAAIERFTEIAVLLTGSKSATAEDGVGWIKELRGKLKIPSLAQFGVKRELIPDLTAKAQRASSMKGNPIELTLQELEEIISSSLKMM